MTHKGMCGLDCGSCLAFLSYRDDNGKLREETALEWSRRYHTDLTPEEINCGGCLSDGPLFRHCLVCGIRKCGMEKNLKSCEKCESYGCRNLKDLQESFS